MQATLQANLKACLSAYIGATGSKKSTVAQRAAGDWRFFDRLEDPGKTFTIRKYEDVMAWFSDFWPDQAPWPDGVGRPHPEPVQSGRPNSARRHEAAIC